MCVHVEKYGWVAFHSYSILNSESSVVSAHVLGSLLLPLFSMNLPIQKKIWLHLSLQHCISHRQTPRTKFPTKLNSITESRKKRKNPKKQKKQKKQRFQRKVGGLIVAGSLVFFCFFGFFWFFRVFRFFRFLCFFGGFAYCTTWL